MLTEAIDALSHALQTAWSTPITYSSGAYSVSFNATPGRSTFEIDNGHGVVEQFDTRDYIFPVTLLILNGSPVTPKRGDRITEGSLTYVVVPDRGVAPWQYSDSSRRMFRVHTKQS